MRIVLAGFGTRGDVQPMVALAKALSGRGHACSVFRCLEDGALRDAGKRQSAATRLDGLDGAVEIVESAVREG